MGVVATRPVHASPYWQGSRCEGGAALFRTWAPASAQVELCLETPQPRRLPMTPEADGFHVVRIEGLRAGARYRYRLADGREYPDPWSRWQPDGPHGASVLCDASGYAWRDAAWRGVRMAGQMLYELHVGTFTPQGTFDAARERLPYLRALGVTLVEIMPIAEFPGRWNWGYDGVSPFAPYHGYGAPDAVRRFVDEAHALGLGVILDVVYNHFGPDGNYLHAFSPHYFTDRYRNEWGEPIDFDGPHAAPVRAVFADNAAYWIGEFHFDGLRLDATQQIFDSTPVHVIAEIARAARAAAAPRDIVLIAENEPQDLRCVRRAADGGFGLDAMCNDDFHHSARVALTGARDGYLHDYEGTAQEWLSAMRRGFLFQGQSYPWQRKRRGTPVRDEPAACFVHFLQNHDQVANTLRGDRLVTLAAPAALRAMTALWLLSPQTPMLFMGQELGARTPFPYFADHGGALGEAVRTGRGEFLAQFAAYASEPARRAIPDPRDAATVQRATLRWDADPTSEPWYRLHRDLLALRRRLPAIAAQARERIDGAVLARHALVVRWLDAEPPLLLIVNVDEERATIAGAEPLLALERTQRWTVRWSSEHPDYGGWGVVSPCRDEGWWLPPRCAVLLEAQPGAPHDDDGAQSR